MAPEVTPSDPFLCALETPPCPPSPPDQRSQRGCKTAAKPIFWQSVGPFNRLLFSTQSDDDGVTTTVCKHGSPTCL